MDAVKELNEKVESLKLEKENIDLLLKQTRGKIDEINLTPEELESKILKKDIEGLENKINNLKLEFNHIFNELKVRVNLELIQQDFYIKNDIVMADLRQKILDQEKEIKLIVNDSSKENTKYRFKQVNINEYKPKVLMVKKIVKYLFFILLLIFAFLLFKIYKLSSPYEEKKNFLILIIIPIIGVVLFNILEHLFI